MSGFIHRAGKYLGFVQECDLCGVVLIDNRTTIPEGGSFDVGVSVEKCDEHVSVVPGEQTDCRDFLGGPWHGRPVRLHTGWPPPDRMSHQELDGWYERRFDGHYVWHPLKPAAG